MTLTIQNLLGGRKANEQHQTTAVMIIYYVDCNTEWKKTICTGTTIG